MGPIFKSFIQAVTQLKEKYDVNDEEKSCILKSALNACYGRFMVNPIKEENIVCQDFSSLSKLIAIPKAHVGGTRC